MALSTRAKRQHDIASPLHPTGETAADSAPPLSNGKKPSKDRESSNTGHESHKIEAPQAQRPWYQVPQTYDPETYDPEGRMPWTPEPEPYDPETYAAWGRKHFGNDWYEQRKIMLQERDIYLPDSVYGSRQRALREMEHEMEGRPFKPLGGLNDKGWQRLWARLSNVMPSTETGSNPAFPAPDDSNSNNGSEQSNISGYSTYPPTPSTREETPYPEDPWERLEWRRRHDNWDEEKYQYEKIFLKEGLIDKVRSERENEEGNRKSREEWEAILKLKWTDNPEYERQKRAHNLRLWNYNHRFDPPEEARASIDRMVAAELRDDPGNANIFRRREPQSATTGDSADAPGWESAGVSQTRASLPRPQEPAKDISRKTRGRGTTKNTARFESVANCGTQSQQAASTLAEASKPDRRTERPRRASDEPNDSTPQGLRRPRKRQPKVYKKERESRRLAGYLPEFGMLPQRGETAAPSEPPSNTRKPTPAGPRRRAPPKKSIGVKGAKPQGIPKSGREKTSRSKRSKKQSGG